jgi:hypothetical protein
MSDWSKRMKITLSSTWLFGTMKQLFNYRLSFAIKDTASEFAHTKAD